MSQLGALKIQLDHRFMYHAPKGNQAERYTNIRRAAGLLATKLAVMCPISRELSVALTKLDEVVFWANAAIARNEHTGEEQPVVINDDQAEQELLRLITEEENAK